ncbi:PEP-CTERM system TPR-repeat protein PrsT [Parahaliea sp. F7430]|uniref:PEP-CTERM system TPR-repeat protein PrsT n=1 Tax=Sediminihaliea albiluteola TaxID=2758564 RepID=A0A7W2TVH4_9GAMM|nr:XrtA/PEP-CTERM system TPR-repeat protein PrsT [Sediminihaliea albiluteola]MBA6412725.1 PEP-CTERM system TPR-repeat protein PrsT [Sediminihaliea albiluteola]
MSYKRSASAALMIVFVLSLLACSSDISDAEYLERAGQNLSAGDSAAAVIQLKNAVRQNPSNMEARLLLGELHFQAGDLEAAEKELGRVIDRASDEQRDRVLPLLAQAWVSLGRLQDVQAIELEGLSDSSRGAVLAAKAMAEMQQGQLAVAQRRLATSLALAPDSTYVKYVEAMLAARNGELATARDHLLALTEQAPDYGLAWALLGDVVQSSNPADAANYYSRAIELNPELLGYRLKRVFVNIQQQAFDAARNDLKVLLNNVPQSPRVNYALGLVEFYAGNYPEALSALLIAEPIKFDIPGVLLYMGLTQAQLGDHNLAYRHIKDFYELDNSNPIGNRFMAEMWVRFGEADKAEQLVRQMLEETPGNSDLLNILANSLVSQQRMDEALDVLSEVARLEPGSASAQMRLGAGYLSAGREQEGFNLLEQAIEMAPESGSADAVLVAALLQEGENKKALEAAQAYRDRAPEQPEPWLLIGRSQFALRDKASAKQAFERADVLEPGNPSANHALATLAFAEQDYAAAKRYYEVVLAEHRDFVPSLMAHAAVSAYQGDFETMLTFLERARSAKPQYLQARLLIARYYLSNQQVENVASAFTGLEPQYMDNPAVLRTMALARLQQGELEQAKQQLQKLFKLIDQPRVADYRVLAAVSEGLGDKEGMVSALNSALELNPEDPGLQLSMARYAYTQADRESFNQHLTEALRLAPGSPQVLQLQAAAANLDGKSGEALSILQQMHADQPSVSTLMNLVQQHLLMRNESLAKDTLESWVDQHPADVAPRLLLAERFRLAGSAGDAMEQFSAVLNVDSNNVVALNNLAWMLRDEQPARALEYARAAVQQTEGKSAAVQDTLAMVLSSNGKYGEARSIFSKLLAESPEVPEFQYHSAQVELAAGDEVTARELLKKLLASDKEFSERAAAEALYAKLAAAD